jgi:Ca-activated chloride channel homolog
VGFLDPGAFVAFGALSLALLASYFLKPRRPSRRVSSTFLWLAALHQRHARRPWQRVPPNVLLLLQLLALATIITALARPYVPRAESTGTDAIVLLDVSASMQATDVAPSRFEAARARVAQMIDGLEPAASLALVSLGAVPQVVAPRTSDQARLRQALGGVQPTTQSANLPAALSLAASLANGHPETQVLVVGDGSLDRSQLPASLPFVVRFVPIGTRAENLAIAAFGTRVLDRGLVALARVTNYGTQPRVATLDLRVDGAHYDARSLAIEPGGSADAQWQDLPVSARVLEAQLAEPDALALDNAAWTVLGADRPTRVLLVSDGNVFLERALALRRGVRVTASTPARYTPELPRAQPYDLVVFDGFLPAGLPERGSLLVLHPPPDNRLLPAHDDVPVSRMGPLRENDPLLADVPLAGVRVNRSRRLDVPVWADAVLGSPETPLLVVGEHGGRRIAVLGFDLHQSDLPLQPGFPVLVQHLLDWLVPDAGVATPVVRVGEPAALAPLPEAQTVDVLTPDGRRVAVGPPVPVPPFGDTGTPGIYRVVQRDASGQETVSPFAVNFLSPRESQLSGATADTAGAPQAGTASAGTAGTTAAAPHELWEGAALLVLALLAAEWWAYHRQ